MITLSIVIPALDESRKISGDIEAAGQFLHCHRMSGEIIVVDDGSSDDTAARARDTMVPAGVGLVVISNPVRRGKGYAIRTGILASHGTYVMFADSGLTVPFENALNGLRLLQEDQCELAHGSRRLPTSTIRKEQDWDRKLISRVFHRHVTRWMQVPPELTDTQCGFKVYRGDIGRELFAGCIARGFMFDIEIILRARRKGCRIAEFPVEWTCDRDSRLSVSRNAWHTIQEMLLIKRMLRIHRRRN
jgi:dolichyl-phosphate beta-glucosyltransferase